MQRLLAIGDVDLNSNSNGWTPRTASQYGHLAVAKLLLDKGAAIEAKTQGGSTLRYVASRNSYKAVAELLLERGAATEAKTQGGSTLLHVAPSVSGRLAVLPNRGLLYKKVPMKRGKEISERSETVRRAIY